MPLSPETPDGSVMIVAMERPLAPDRRAHPAAVSRSLSVVIPAFNEESRLPRTLRDMDAYLRGSGYDAELIVVDDGSLDRTRSVAESLRSDIPYLRVLGYRPNRGKGFAVRTGVLAATRGAVLFSDADQSTPIAEVSRFWPWLDQGYGAVIASRAVAGSDILVPQPIHRRVLGRIFRELVSALAVRRLRDTQCGFKLFRADAARAVFRDLRTPGFAFDVEALLRTLRLGYSVAEVGVRWSDSRESKVRGFRDGTRMLVELLRMRGML